MFQTESRQRAVHYEENRSWIVYFLLPISSANLMQCHADVNLPKHTYLAQGIP